MKTYKALIIDDEFHNREQLVRLLTENCPNVNIVGVASSSTDAKQMIGLTHPDVIFLDIEMPGGTGFDLLRSLESIDFKVIFVTAYNTHALKAIKFSALDYILKPIDVQELKTAVEKLDGRISKKEKSASTRNKKSRTFTPRRTFKNPKRNSKNSAKKHFLSK